MQRMQNDGWLKYVAFGIKKIALQCTSIKIHYDQSFHIWKVIPVKLIDNTNLTRI